MPSESFLDVLERLHAHIERQRQQGVSCGLYTYSRLQDALKSRKHVLITQELALFHAYNTIPSLCEFKVALQALLYIRVPNKPIKEILATYRAMRRFQIAPDRDCFEIVLFALCDREREILYELEELKSNLKWSRSMDGRRLRLAAVDILFCKKKIYELRNENNFNTIIDIFNKFTTDLPGASLAYNIYSRILCACADNANASVARQIYNYMRQSIYTPPNTECYSLLMLALVNAGEIGEAEYIFKKFRQLALLGRF